MISSFRCNQLDYTVIILFTFLLTGSCIFGKPQGESLVKESRPSSRRLVASRTDDGFWSANARLPTGFQSGQTDHSRYKVRRDGSISLALKLPSMPRPSYNQGPSELRSFSVVLSDVDVVGGYNDSDKSVNSTQDAYKNAGVSMYKLHSNSIHRMNASWKLNPSNSSPTSPELVDFLKFFASSSSTAAPATNETEHTSSAFHQDNEHGSNYAFKKEPNEQRNRRIEHRDGGDEMMMMGIEVPLKTHVDDNRSATDVSHNIKSILGSSARTNGASGAIVLHDLISTLGKLNNNVRQENRTAYLEDGEEGEEEKRMKPVDPQQTAADLKRLMALLFTSAKNETNNTNSNKNDKDHVDLVNVLIAPTSDGSGTGKSNQKIIVLPNAQMKKLISKVVESSSMSSSSPPLMGSIDNKDHPEIPITPPGFPITAGGYLNLHHPNLQFHQALHHLIANGTAPTSINTTVKTNIINVFVLNFNDGPNKQTSSNNEQREKDSGIQKTQQVKQTQKQPSIEQSSFLQFPSNASKPIVIEKVQGSPLVFYEKIGVLSAPISPSTPPTTTLANPTTTSTERVNILDLLPADLNAFKQVNDDDESEQGPDLTSGAHKILTSLTRDPNHNSGASHDHQHHHHSAVTDLTRPVHVYVKTPLAVPHLWLLHQNSRSNNSNGDKQVEPSLPDYEDPDFPEDKISYGGKFPVGPDSSFQDLYDDSPLTTTITPETIITTSKRSPFYALRNNQTIKDPFLYRPHSNYSTKGSNNSSDSLDNVNQIVMSQLESANKIKPAASPPDNNDDDSRYNTTAAITSTNEDDSNLRNRVRKVLTALGYSALPTLAAGAAATWPYWVPLVATAGKKRRKKRTSNNSNRSNLFLQATGGEEPIIAHQKGNPTKLQAVNKATEFAESEQPLPFQAFRTRRRPTSGKLASLKATTNLSSAKFNPSFTSNSSRNKSGDQAKWIRVEVITESSLSSSLSASPTLKPRHHVNLTKHNKPNHHLHLSATYSDNRPISPPDDNLRYDLLHYTSDNNTTTTDNSVVPTKKQDLPLLTNFFKNVISNEWNMTTSTISPDSTTIKHLKRPGHLVNTTADLTKSHVQDGSTLETDNESLIKLQKLESLTFAKNAYASAILLPLWLPVLLGRSTRQARAPTTIIHRTRQTKTADVITAGRDDDKLTTEGQPRHHRRLTKWPKTSDVTGSDANVLADHDEGSLLYQSLKAMETHLLEKPEDEMLESSSEKDVYLQDGNGGGSGETSESSDEDDDAEEDDEDKANFVTDGKTGGVDDGDNQHDVTKEKMDVHMNKLQQLKQAHQHQKTTTPKGLTTWSAVGSGGAPQPPRGTVQKVSMSDFTISSALAFTTTQSTIKPITTADIVTKDRTEAPTTTDLPTTELPETFRPVTIIPTKPKRRPMHQKKPPKYVKPPLDDVTATVIGSDETHNVYVLKPVNDPETKTATPDLMASYTKQPWPFMTTKKSPFMKIRTTARPIKNAYAKRTQTPKLSLTTPTTPKPQTTTVYYRNPTPGFTHPIIPLSFTNLSFMDFIRTQVVPKIGLSMISFIATSPLILTMLGAVGRKKRDLSEITGKSTSAQDWKFSEYLESLATKWERQLNSSTESSIYNGYQSADFKPKKRNKLKNSKHSSGKY